MRVGSGPRAAALPRLVRRVPVRVAQLRARAQGAGALPQPAAPAATRARPARQQGQRTAHGCAREV